ncbi:MAG: tetratricopeptide repeat protein [Candidatus Rokubacteria bacterium]|nr:tetratricopeptide repeat protein [Candidatus Rokubacteria bacterium]
MPPKLTRVVLVLALPLITACAGRVGPLDRGIAYYRGGQYEAALQAFDEAVRLAPREASTWNNRALARLRMGQTTGALADLTKAIELSPADPELNFNRGNVYMALGNHDYAVQDFNRAVALAPGYAKAYFNRGVARVRAGDFAGAEADWRYAIAMEADPAVQATMIRTAGLGPAGAGSSLAGSPGSAPTSRTDVPSALPALREPAATPESVDARVLTLRAISRELDGDRHGAIRDLREAAVKEPDARRRAVIERLLRDVEGAR